MLHCYASVWTAWRPIALFPSMSLLPNRILSSLTSHDHHVGGQQHIAQAIDCSLDQADS